jgi:hypothetical protein
MRTTETIKGVILGLCIAAVAVFIALLVGCVSSTRDTDHVRRLQQFPGAEEAFRAAPGFYVEVLRTIEDLQIERDAAARWK